MSELRLAENKAELTTTDGQPVQEIRVGDVISIHGQTGEVFVGSLEVLSVTADKGKGEPES